MKKSLKFSILASGSGGNACYVETKNARVLIDAGLSCREIERRMGLVGVNAGSLDAIVLTHEHTDHIRGAGPLARRHHLTLYGNRKTLERGQKALGNIPKPVVVQTGESILINDLTVETFTKCHDAADPMGIALSLNGIRIGLATDLGKITRLAQERLKGCRVLIVEFNYDPQMLEQGPYPLFLKRRIKGRDGHLSNRQGGDLLTAVSHPDLELVVLAHLSETNNHPDKAHREAVQALEDCGLRETRILIGRQHEPGPMIEL